MDSGEVDVQGSPPSLSAYTVGFARIYRKTVKSTEISLRTI